MKFNLTKDNAGLIPATDKDRQKLNKVGLGEVFACKTIDQRNYKLLQKYWVLMDFAYENLPEKYDGYWATVEDFEEEVLKAIGWKTVSKDFRGNDVVKAKSISYESVPDDETFSKIYKRCLDLICRMIGVEGTEIMDELLNF